MLNINKKRSCCYFIFFGVLLLGSFTSQAQTWDRCTDLGYNAATIYQIEKNLQQALAAGNIHEFAKQFNYPFVVNLKKKNLDNPLPNCSRIIHTENEMVENFSAIYNEAEVKDMLSKLKDTDLKSAPFCNYQGAMIFGGMWISMQKNTQTGKNQLGVVTINAPQTATLSCDLPFGEVVQPVTDMEQLNRFAESYNQSEAEKDKPTGSIHSESYWNNYYFPNLLNGKVNRGFILYDVDIQNDGVNEFVMVYPCEGSACTSGIDKIYTSRNGHLDEIDYRAVFVRNFNLGDMSRWYLYIAEPFITIKDGKYYLNFANSNPPAICTYLWQKDKLILAHGSQALCIH